MDQSVSSIIFDDTRKKILLIKRRDVPVWVLPGGGIDPGESPENAAVREVFEETGCEAFIVRKVANYHPINPLCKTTHFFECKLLSEDLKTGSETRAIQFFDLNNLPKALPPPYPDWINDGVLNLPELLEKKITSVTYPVILKSILMHPILVLRFFLTKIGIYINSKN